MATRLRPLTLSPGHYIYLVATLLLLAVVVGIAMMPALRQFYAEHVSLPPLAREFGFTLGQDESVGWMVIPSVVPGGIFDRVGIRAGDLPVGDEDYPFHQGLPDFLSVLDNASRGKRVEVMVEATQDVGKSPPRRRCAWIDLNDLRANPAKRTEAVACGDGAFKVQVSLVMMWIPKCCAFDLTITGSHEATLALTEPIGHQPATRTQRFSVSEAGWNEIRDAVRVNEFFDLPDEVGDRPIDASVRTLYVTRGDKSQTIRFFDCSKRKDDAVKRACAVWDAVTRQIPFPEVTER